MRSLSAASFGGGGSELKCKAKAEKERMLESEKESTSDITSRTPPSVVCAEIAQSSLLHFASLKRKDVRDLK
jgi:hypothetical protein